MMVWVTVVLFILPLVYTVPTSTPTNEDINKPHVEITQDKFTKDYKILIKTENFEKLEEIQRDGTVFGDYRFKVNDEYKYVTYVFTKDAFFFTRDNQPITVPEDELKKSSSHQKRSTMEEYPGRSPVGPHIFFDDISNTESHFLYHLQKHYTYITPFIRYHQTHSYFNEENASNDSENDSTELENENMNEDSVEDSGHSTEEEITTTGYNVSEPQVEDQNKTDTAQFRPTTDGLANLQNNSALKFLLRRDLMEVLQTDEQSEEIDQADSISESKVDLLKTPETRHSTVSAPKSLGIEQYVHSPSTADIELAHKIDNVEENMTEVLVISVPDLDTVKIGIAPVEATDVSL